MFSSLTFKKCLLFSQRFHLSVGWSVSSTSVFVISKFSLIETISSDTLKCYSCVHQSIPCAVHKTQACATLNKLHLFIYLHACLCYCACLSCKTSLASLCRGHANWTVKKRQDRLMFPCSPLTGAVLPLYVSWWVWGQGLTTGVTFITAPYCEIVPDVCPH